MDALRSVCLAATREGGAAFGAKRMLGRPPWGAPSHPV